MYHRLAKLHILEAGDMIIVLTLLRAHMVALLLLLAYIISTFIIVFVIIARIIYVLYLWKYYLCCTA